MNRSSRRSKTPANLSESVRQQLNAYAIVAGAAGVGMLALVQPAGAKIVYTPTHQVTTRRHPLLLDLNHDGINDFAIATYYAGGSGSTAGVRAYGLPKFTGANRVMGKGNYAYAFRAGIQIGPKKQFSAGDSRMASWVRNGNGTTTHFRGLWAKDGNGVKNRYLGLRLKIKGKVHYGWARVTTTFDNNRIWNATLTGYAYETIPNKAIVAGKTKGAVQIDSKVEQPNSSTIGILAHEPATLGLLAMGSPGLSIWRREESLGVAP